MLPRRAPPALTQALTLIVALTLALAPALALTRTLALTLALAITLSKARATAFEITLIMKYDLVATVPF